MLNNFRYPEDFYAEPISATPIDVENLLYEISSLIFKLKTQPNVIITTKYTLSKIRETLDTLPSKTSPEFRVETIYQPPNISGIPIEDYATVGECLDRMLQPGEGQRPRLMLLEGIPSHLLWHLLWHPWARKLMAELLVE